MERAQCRETRQVRGHQRRSQSSSAKIILGSRGSCTATAPGSVRWKRHELQSGAFRNENSGTENLGAEKLMRPLTIGRLLLQCLVLATILFCVMVLALKFGAIHVSLYGLGRDLLRVFLGKSTDISSEYSLIVLNIRLPRILLSSNVRGMAYWLMGELSNLPSRPLDWVLRAGFLVATAIIYTTASDLNLLLSGEKEAMHLGVDVHRVRLIVYVAASALTGLAVAVSGSIGYVGLLVPHVMRMIFGSDHRILIPASAFGGAIAVVIADTIARTIAAPADLPVGAITAIAGAPLFIYLLRRRFA